MGKPLPDRLASTCTHNHTAPSCSQQEALTVGNIPCPKKQHQGGSNTTKTSFLANKNPVYVVITEVWSFWQKIIFHLVRIIHRWPRPRNTWSKKTGGKRADGSMYSGWFLSSETDARVKGEFTPPPSLILWKIFRLSQVWGLAPVIRWLRQEGGDTGSALGNTRPCSQKHKRKSFLPHLSSPFFLLCCMKAEGKWLHLSQKATFPVLTRNYRETEQSYLISTQTIRILVMILSQQNLSEIGWLN